MAKYFGNYKGINARDADKLVEWQKICRQYDMELDLVRGLKVGLFFVTFELYWDNELMRDTRATPALFADSSRSEILTTFVRKWRRRWGGGR